MEEHFRKLERMYLSARVNTQHFPTTSVEIGKGTARIGIVVDDSYHHALNAMHGSVYFKLLDDAAFFAVSSLVRDVFVLTTSFNLNMIRPHVSGPIYAEGKVRFSSKEIYTAESVLYNQAGKELAFGTGNFAKSKVGLSSDIGYV